MSSTAKEHGREPDNRWQLISQRIAELPQMRCPTSTAAMSRPPAVIRDLDRRPYGVGLHALGGRRGTVIALGLIAAFALGYLAGKF